MRYEKPYISVYKSIAGWQSQMIAWFPDDGMWDVVQTGMGPYKTRKKAEEDAKFWAEYEEVELRLE